MTKEEIKDSVFTALRKEFDSSQNNTRLVEIWITTKQLGYFEEAQEMEEELRIENVIKK